MARPPSIENQPTVVKPRTPDDLEPPPSRGIGWGMLLGALVVIAAAAIGAAVYFATRDDGSTGAQTTTSAPTTTAAAAARRVFVPDVTGLKQDEAAGRLAEKRLVPVIRYRPTRKPTGLVVEQRPKAAKQVRRGTNVVLVVDRGVPSVAVPNLVGLEVAAAGSRLAKAGLKAQTTPVTSAGATPGTVVSQAPEAGAKAKHGSVVTLSVARNERAATTPTSSAPTTTAPDTTTAPAPPARVTVPDVGGGDLKAAAAALYGANLRATVRYVPAGTPLEAIVAQSPASGTTVPARSRVTVTVSTGPGDKPEQTVPDVAGQQLRQAVGTLNAAGLRLIFVKVPVTSRAQVGTVVGQTPPAGGSAPPKAQVLVELGVLR